MDMAAHPAILSPPRTAADRLASWRDLARNAAEANSFYAPAMLNAAIDHLAADGVVHVVEAWAEDVLIGLMPVQIHDRHGRFPLRCTGNWMHDHCFYGAPIIRHGHEEAALRGLLTQIDAAAWAPGFLHLQAIDAHGPTAAAIAATCARDGRGYREIHRYDRALLQSDLTADAYWEAHVRAKKRKELRRLQKRLADLGAVSTRVLTERADIASWCDAFLTLEASGWKGAEGSALACKDSDSAFFRAAVDAAYAQGELHMLRLDLDDRPIAMLANFRHLDGAFSFKIAIDEELGRFSPGVLIEIANLHSVLDDEVAAWMDSCAAPGHPMIDSLWAERRTIVQYRIALRGRGAVRLRRAAAYAAANSMETCARMMKGRP